MNNLPKRPRIIFLNQVTGPLFRELAEDISQEWSPTLLLSGRYDMTKSVQAACLSTIASPKYRRDSYLSRILSWIHYFVYVLLRSWRLWPNALLFLVSNPPFLGIIGYLFKRLRGQRYVILVYDIYPDMLIRFSKLKETGLIARLWRRMNRLVWENAEIVFTIDEKMAANLEQNFDTSKTSAGKVVVIPNWANTDWIRPLAKDKNEFAKKYNQIQKLTVMYSGNLGQTHDIETILSTAKELKENSVIHFMIIGKGAKKDLIEEIKEKDDLDNLTTLSFQPEETLPSLLSTADIAIITLDKGSEGLMVPSKTYYSMAAGSALLGLCDDESKVAQIIKQHDCGIVVNPGETSSMAKAILDLLHSETQLRDFQTNSRSAAEKYYSRKNTSMYIDALSAIKFQKNISN